MDSNPQLELAYNFVASTGENVFLTGRAGTGKTTFLRSLREKLPKRMIVVAPTGVAAINAGGVTMHSFFQLPFGIFIPGVTRQSHESRRFSKVKIAIIRSLELLVIDEISMVRADTLDSVDEVLRRFRNRSKPFGGVQLLMIGDMQQLAPVTRNDEWEILHKHYPSPYFFDSRALKQTSYTSIELQQIFRQSDAHFIDMLGRVRDNRIDEPLLRELNARHRPAFDPPQSEGYITLTSHNHTARGINDQRLAAIPLPEYVYTAEIEGDFPEYLYPAESQLRLRQSAQVMFTKNDPSPEHRFVNGSIGEVVRLDDDLIEVQLASGGEPIVVEIAEWENTKYSLSADTGEITMHTEGVFRQYPLKTAWAITIHKSQGLTFERAIIDAADSFSHGQVYVALSRCRTLEGIVLRTPLGRTAVISDQTVDRFSRHVEEAQPDEVALRGFQKQYYERLLREMFDFGRLYGTWRTTGNLMEENLSRLFPKFIEKWLACGREIAIELRDVGVRFGGQISRLMQTEDYASDPTLTERVRRGADYFLEHLAHLPPLTREAATLPIDNKETRKRLKELVGSIDTELGVKLSTLSASREQFTVESYMKAKGAAIAAAESGLKHKGSKASKSTLASGDIPNPELFELLRKWRKELADQQNVPAYVVASQKAITGIAGTLPQTPSELLAIKGIGPAFLKKHGTQVLEIVKNYILL
jgi:energy-coupling factor transporter ATP-binding protein EcfA2